MGRRATLWQVLLIKIHEINGSHVSSRARFLFLHCCVIPTFFCTLFVSSFVRFFILTLLCHTYIFLKFVCIICCEIFILTLLYHTYIFLFTQAELSVVFLFMRECSAEELIVMDMKKGPLCEPTKLSNLVL